MTDIELEKALSNIKDCYPDFLIGTKQDCCDDPDVRNGLISFLKEFPNASTSDVIEEVSHLHGIPYWDDKIKEQVYKYPQFKYKFLKKANKHI